MTKMAVTSLHPPCSNPPPTLHTNFIALCVIEAVKVLHGAIMDSRREVDDLHIRTWPVFRGDVPDDTYVRFSKVIVWQTDATNIIYHVALQVVNNYQYCQQTISVHVSQSLETVTNTWDNLFLTHFSEHYLKTDVCLWVSHVAQSCYSVIVDKPLLWSKPKIHEIHEIVVHQYSFANFS